MENAFIFVKHFGSANEVRSMSNLLMQAAPYLRAEKAQSGAIDALFSFPVDKAGDLFAAIAADEDLNWIEFGIQFH